MRFVNALVRDRSACSPRQGIRGILIVIHPSHFPRFFQNENGFISPNAMPHAPASRRPMISSPGLWLRLAAALGIGLLVGVEREHKKGEGAARAPAGIRSFTLTAMLGAVSF